MGLFSQSKRLFNRPRPPNLVTGPQVTPEEVSTLKHKGFETIICNRPDDEEDGQPPFEFIALAAEENGMRAHYIPVHDDQDARDKANAFREAVQIGRPVYAYCRSGARSTLIAQFAGLSG